MKNTTWRELRCQILTEEERAYNDFLVEIVAKIIEKRNSLELSQKDLEEKTGIKREAISRIEGLKNSPQLNTIFKLLKPLGLKLVVEEA
ncbi:MAG: helix-turn-helix domain-containing protein [Bacilli bacterium]